MADGSEPYLHCQCGHSIYAHLPTGKCDMPDCVCGGFDQCDCRGEKNR